VGHLGKRVGHAPLGVNRSAHELLTSVYSDSPGGEPGNDDLGAMNSWYVWASLGIYPETPGTPVLALGAPIFSRRPPTSCSRPSRPAEMRRG
jgi:putative alpha-1,2-mannosidase